MSNHTRRARLWGAAGVVLLIAAVIALITGFRAEQHAPQPPAAAASQVDVTPSTSSTQRPAPSASSPATSSSTPPTVGPILPASMPTTLDVPAIGLHTSLRHIGLTAAGAIRTPPLDRDSHAYWLDVSPEPGQLGPATIIGHVDSAAYGQAVFFRLGALRQRDLISVSRADGIVAVFQVERVVVYPKAGFPHPGRVRESRSRRPTADYLRRGLQRRAAQLRKQHRRLRFPRLNPPGITMPDHRQE